MSTIVISVGTSLITNNRDVKDLEDHFGTVTSFLSDSIPESVQELPLSFENGKLSHFTHCDLNKGLYYFSQKFFEKYMEEDQIKRNIGLRKNGGDRLPAEISSLYLYYYDRDGTVRKEFQNRLNGDSNSQFEKKDQVVLLTTDTADAVYCANLLREMIKHVPLFTSKCEVEKDVVVIQNLDVYEPSRWAYGSPEDTATAHNGKRGIENLIDYFRENFSDDAVEGERVLIRTGGYKELSSLLMLIAVQFRFVSLYLFKRSLKFVRLYVNNLPEETDLTHIIQDTTYVSI